MADADLRPEEDATVQDAIAQDAGRGDAGYDAGYDGGDDARDDADRAPAVPLDLLAATALLLLAAVAVAVGAPAPVRSGGLLAAVAGLAAVSGRRALWRAPEALLLALGGALAGMVILGALLALSPVGVPRAAWAAVLAVTGGLVLLASSRRPVVRRLPRPSAGALVWGVLALAVAGGGLAVAVRASQLSDVPPLQMWADESVPGQVAVELRAPGPSGPYDLWVEPVGGTPQLVSSGLNLPGGDVVRVVLPGDARQRAQVVLRDPAGTEPVRSLLVEGS